MIKARKRFVLYAMLCVFLLLFVLLGIINGLNFTMAGKDADEVTEMLAQQRGMFNEPAIPMIPEGQEGELPSIMPPETQGEEQQGMGPSSEESQGEEQQAMGPSAPDSQAEDQQGMGPSDENAQREGQQAVPTPDPNQPVPVFQGNLPGGFFPGFIGPIGIDSQDLEFSLRYFTFAFDADGNAEQVAFQISAVTEEEALEWARSLQNEHDTGWTRISYRYRVFQDSGKTYVTVIDQGRELLPSYRILLISGIGLIAGLIISYIALMFIGRKLFRPLEEADRKQKRFIADAEKEFKIPLTIINANTEIMERENGETDQTLSINRQVKKMLGLVKNLSTVGVFDESELIKLQCDISALAQAIGDTMKSSFAEKERVLEITANQPVIIDGDSEAMSQLISELLENALKFCKSRAELKVGEEDGHQVIIATNDTDLPDGSVDQVFDRFTRLENAKDLPGVGLGLSHVKEIVQAHNGRANAKVLNGEFILRINL